VHTAKAHRKETSTRRDMAEELRSWTAVQLHTLARTAARYAYGVDLI